MSEREELSARRLLTRQKAWIGGQGVFVDVGFYDKEKTRIGELFILVDKSGSVERFLLNELAVMTSLAIQYGAPVEELMEQWLFTRGQISGPVVGDARIKNATSALDYVARHVLVYYCGREELAHVNEIH